MKDFSITVGPGRPLALEKGELIAVDDVPYKVRWVTANEIKVRPLRWYERWYYNALFFKNRSIVEFKDAFSFLFIGRPLS